jgi:hypothetical protein
MVVAVVARDSSCNSLQEKEKIMTDFTEDGWHVVSKREKGVEDVTIANELLRRLRNNMKRGCPLYSCKLKTCGYDWLYEALEILPTSEVLEDFNDLAPINSIESALRKCGNGKLCNGTRK